MIKFATIPCLALGLATAATAAMPMLHEEQLARAEEALIITSPIAGIENRFWFDYRIDVIEAQKELTSDLRRASDIEDQRDAWEEYAHELKHERVQYIEEMAERGYRAGRVYFVD
ncbi:hypothetical protein [Qipengyuania nanhaisediminis]|uniref:DUF4148 domain-containing protein n=1 Tax=Qipengyuania nanhaisediminis TaxID=604088 RepID=A0A1I5PDN2_9SPHN|nr:hypothetical protein [Qipengyuania nanhaisediminis]SFP31651.1 hypothetical protein SAMN04488060_2308 [Qipengyuania nanhaisediminis]